MFIHNLLFLPKLHNFDFTYVKWQALYKCILDMQKFYLKVLKPRIMDFRAGKLWSS
jgi:hypothetical protein